MTALVDAVLVHATERPDSIAIEAGEDGSLTWRQLQQRIERLTARLRQSCPPQRPVALQLDQGLAACIADLALIAAELPGLPLPAFFTPDQRDHALRTTGACALVTADPLDTDGIGLPPLDLPAAVLPAGTAKISFTSGSTGTPKGICLSASHLAVVAQSVVDYVGSRHAGRHLALLPPGILLENIAGFHATLLAGGTYLALPQTEVGLANPFRPDFAAMVQAIATQAATSLILVPEYLVGIVATMEANDLRLPALTLVAVGGARVPPALLERAVAVGLPVRQGYGLTECGSVVALEDGSEQARGSVGRPLGLNRISIADDGEILIEGPAHLGTIGVPRSATLLATGDIGRIDDDGRLWIEGRKSNLIVTSYGRNIAPEWIESLLLGHPAIAQAMVHGDGAASLGALVVPARPDADMAAAITTINARLPGYAQIGHWQAVPPFTPANGQLTGNGRLRRTVIHQHYLRGSEGMTFFERLAQQTAHTKAVMASVPQLQAGLSGEISRTTYLAYLTQAYHHVRHTVPLLSEARARLAHRPDLAAALDAYIEEETGHEQWILDDIAAAGGDPDAAATSLPHPATQAMVDHAYTEIRCGNPVGLFGMVYVLEGTSVAMALQGAAAVQERLGLPDAAFSYLTSHGALDQNHMCHLANVVNGLTDPADQQAVIDMANDMFRLFGAMFAAIPLETLNVAA